MGMQVVKMVTPRLDQEALEAMLKSMDSAAEMPGLNLYSVIFG